MMLSGPAPGQVGDPVVVGDEDQLEGLRFTDFRASLELSLRYRDESERRRDASASSRTLELREMVELSTKGYAGHPNLFEFDLLGRFTPTQRYSDTDALSRFALTQTQAIQEPLGVGRRAWDLEFITEYDFVGRILKESDLPATVYSRRTDAIVSRPFSESFDSTTTEHGIRVDWRHELYPGNIQYFHRDIDMRSDSGTFDNRLVQDTVQFHNRAQIGPRQLLSLDYTFDDIAQSGAGVPSRSYQRHDALLLHNLDFGENAEHSLRSQLYLFDESGFTDTRRLRLFELLRMRHDPDFETRYDYTFDWVRRPGVDQRLHRGQAGFQHRLFESLVTTGNVGASHLRLENPGFSSAEGFGDIDFQYTKKVPYGRLNAGASFRYSHREDSDRNGSLQIVNEPHTFSGAGIIVIQRRRIDVGSIVMTNAAGTFTYSEGLDYFVLDFVEQVEIRRAIGGNIPDGATVLLSYRFGPDPGQTTDTLSMRYTVRYDFEDGPLRGLGVYGRYFQQDQWRSEEPMDRFLPPADIREIVYGADYSIGSLTLLAERTHRESTISPVRSTRLEGRYSRPFGRDSSVVLTGTWLDLDRYQDDIRTTILTVSARWNQQLTDRLHMGVEVRWRDERDNALFDVQGFEQRLELNWRYRQTTVHASLRNTWLDSDLGNSRFHDLFVGLRREF